MTCIVAVTHERYGSVLGGDSASVSGWFVTPQAEPKVWRHGGFLLGVSGDWRLQQLLRYAFTPPPQADEQSDHAYMVTTWVDAVRTMLRERGALKCENGVERAGVGEVVIAYRHRLYLFDGDLQVTGTAADYLVSGSGREPAAGALHATRNAEAYFGSASLRYRATAALEAAAAHTGSVCAPFHCVALPPPEPGEGPMELEWSHP